uniref:carbonic anhydrase n=1 Tax=Timema monikensis TaxID=170555 RepID=A0A7R9HMP7_9NEOP|nr:unnamed protein product [Timema monikensis]
MPSQIYGTQRYEIFNIGPATWAKKYPEAAGSRQSPVDIVTSLATSVSTHPLSWKYVPRNCKYLANTGYGWKVDVTGEGSELTGGPLVEKHTLEQFHCHWGCDSRQGSEHTVDGKAFAGEAGKSHSELEKIVKLIPKITHRGQKVPTTEPIDIVKFLPHSPKYWTYLGSLTTPPCSESVTWILFKEPVEVSEKQLSVFRSLRCYGPGESCPCDELQGLVVNNYRPPLPMGNRELRECGSG